MDNYFGTFNFEVVMPKKKQYAFHICLTGPSKIREMLDNLVAQERSKGEPSSYTSVTRKAINEYYVNHFKG